LACPAVDEIKKDDVMSSLTGAFNLGVNGLFASSAALGALSQNLSNSRTPGYRQLQTPFSTLLGGIDVRGTQPGGVRAMTRTNMDVQGPLEVTNRKFDIAIDGPGLFIFGPFDGGTGPDDFRFSRDGSLISIRASRDDSVGYLGNETGLYLLGWRLQNEQVVSEDLADLEPIPATTDDAFPGQATANADLVATLPAEGTTAATQIFYFDAAGVRQSLWLNWTKNSPNNWTLQPTDLNGAPVGAPIPMTFDGRGNLTSAPTVTIAGQVNLDVSKVNQVGTLFSMGEYIQDGIEVGEFVAYEILPDGRVNARYTNGAVRSLYKIPVATFMNPSALIEESGTMYRVSEKSGNPQLNEVGEQSIQIVAGAVEMANFDLADGFTQLIVTQRAYDTAAQVVRTVDEMSQVVRDMVR
jgi:flagellar hook protein FlgE